LYPKHSIYRESVKKRFIKNTADDRRLLMANLLRGSLPIEGQRLQLPLNRN